MWKVVFLICLIFLEGCSDRTNIVKSKIKAAENDGFEVIAIFNNTNVKSVRYKNIRKISDSDVSFLLPIDRLDMLSKSIKNTNKHKKIFVELDVKAVSEKKQDICLEYHYTKSTYVYCYVVSGQSITPKYSEYRDMTRTDKTIYE